MPLLEKTFPRHARDIGSEARRRDVEASLKVAQTRSVSSRMCFSAWLKTRNIRRPESPEAPRMRHVIR